MKFVRSDMVEADATEELNRWRFSRKLIVCLALLTLARLIAAAFIPLTEDEAYYRLWAMRPAFGYFDHPPMAAWWIAVGRAIVGDTSLGARLMSVFSTALVSLFIVDIARMIGLSNRASERAAIWYNAALLIGLGGAVITPDAPATCFWTITLWALVSVWRSGDRRWWLLAGAGAGLACLSKYSALFIGPGVLLWLFTSKTGRAELLRPWPWLALIIAAAVFSPNIVWNASHHWLSFDKQFSRVEPSGFTPQHVLDFPVTQFFLLNPLIAIFAVRGLMDFNWRDASGNGAGLRLLLVSVAPFLAYLVLHSLHAGVQAHWPAPLYPAFAIWASRAADRRTSGGWRRMAQAVPWLGFGLSAIVLLHMALPQTDWKKDPALPLRGWSALAGDAEALRVKEGAGWVGTFSYGAAAQLLAQNKINAPVVELIERARYTFEAPPRTDGPGVVIDLDRRIGDQDLTPCFGVVQRLPDLKRGDPNKPGLTYHAYLVSKPLVDIAAQGCREGKDRVGKEP